MKCKVAVIGAGVIGLTSAVRIQDQLGDKVEITLYTADKSPNTTGDVSAGYWTPYLIQSTPREKIMKWAKESQDYFLKLWRNGLALECGLSLIPVICFTKEYSELPNWHEIMIGRQKFSDEIVQKYSQLHKRNYKSGYHYVTFTCEPTKFLPYLEKEFVARSGKIVIRKIKSFSELNHYDLVVNCTGLYSRYLNSDNEVEPIRGQVARVKAPWQFHVEFDNSDDGHYIIPNQHCVILGGTHQVKDEDTTPRQRDTDFILNGCTQLVPSLKNAKVIKHQAGLRPGRASVKLELETKLVDGKMVQIIHNYGHGGSGVTLSYGCAGEVAELAEQALGSKRSKL